MRKFTKTTESDDILDELLEGIELAEQAQEEEEAEEAKTKKKSKKEKKEKKEKEPDEEKLTLPKEDEEEETFNPNGLPIVLERIDAGLIGSLRIHNTKMNRPIFKEGDLAQLRKPNRLLVKDFVLYKIQDEYFLRRIIKFKENDIYVAGDNEKEYHIIHKENIIAKAVGRERGKKYLSLGFNPKNKFYTFTKVNLAPLRLGNRVKSYDEEQNADAFAAAMQNMEVQQQTHVQQPEYQTIDASLDLDSDLQAFLDPDELVREFRGELEPEPEIEEEEIVYVNEDGEEVGKPVEYLEDLDGDQEFHAGSIPSSPISDNEENNADNEVSIEASDDEKDAILSMLGED